MNNYIKRKKWLIINSILFIMEVILSYLIVKSFITKDFISPNDITFLEYIKIKLINLI